MKLWFKQLFCWHKRAGKEYYLLFRLDMWWLWAEDIRCTKCYKSLPELYPIPYRPGHWKPTPEWEGRVLSEEVWRQKLWWL